MFKTQNKSEMENVDPCDGKMEKVEPRKGKSENAEEEQYLDLIRHIIANGARKGDRTGTGQLRSPWLMGMMKGLGC